MTTSTDASAEPAVDDGFDEVPRRRTRWRAGLVNVGAIVGGLGLAGVAVAMLALGSLYSDRAYSLPADEEATVPVLAAPDPSSASTPDPAPKADEPAELHRIDPAWANRTATATGIPLRALLAYASATVTVIREQPSCGIAWNTLAGIGSVESAHGSHDGSRLLASGLSDPTIRGPALNGAGVGRMRDTDRGAVDGDAAWDRAVGPMQFIPSTWRKWGADGNGDGRNDPDQIDDAALAAARYLCASGSMRTPTGWRAAVFSYNHSDSYVDRVAAVANQYAAAGR